MTKVPGSASIETRTRVTCPHCGITATPEARYYSSAVQFRNGSFDPKNVYPCYTTFIDICPGCGAETILLGKWQGAASSVQGLRPTGYVSLERVYPIGQVVKSFPNAIDVLVKDYTEACRVVGISAAASACMSRRCMQGILKDKGYRAKDLVKQIELLLAETDPKRLLPDHLHRTVDAVRNFGNFGAHPMTDVANLQLIEVEDGEAEWCIRICEALMDHYYEAPKRVEAAMLGANKKFAAAGKPPMKGG